MRKLEQHIAVLLTLVIAGCALTPPDVIGDGTQLQTRQIQTRNYATLDKAMTMRSVISTLQDLGFTIDTADVDLGTITATRLDQRVLRMTVTVVQRDEQEVVVRTNARIDRHPIEDPETYQDFFVALDRAMFLTRNSVD